MRVRKFEAKTMKEAFEMVKRQLGPDAIILAAKDRPQRFGIAGGGSVEITAAVSELGLKKKEIAESKLPAKDKEKFASFGARKQKEFIEKALKPRSPTAPPPLVQQPPKKDGVTKIPYIEIADEDTLPVSASTDRLPEIATKRVKVAAQRAWEAFLEDDQREPSSPRLLSRRNEGDLKKGSNKEIESLKGEIVQLRQIIENFQVMPQSFVQLHPGAEEGINFELSPVFERLIKVGVEREYAKELVMLAQKELALPQHKKRAVVEGLLASHLMKEIKTVDRLESGVHLFVGPMSQGKTTSLVKLASQAVIREKKKVALLTTDVFKVGAAEQLKIYSQILNVPFGAIWDPASWIDFHNQLKDVDLIFVDYPSLTLKSEQEKEWLKVMRPKVSLKCHTHYVQSALSGWEESQEFLARYMALGFDDVIVTHLDETLRHGVILNITNRFKKPLLAFGVGSSVPEDIEIATRERVVDLIFQLSKFSSREGEGE